MYNNILAVIESMINECEFIEQLTTGLTPETDLGLTMDGIKTFRAICFGEQTIGEATSLLGKMTDGKFYDEYPEIQWRSIKGMRNHIVHEYLDIDPVMILSAAIEDIPKLHKTLNKAKTDLEKEA